MGEGEMGKKIKFHSINAVKKHYFPKSYKKEMEEKAIEKLGLGVYLANQFLNQFKKALKK